MTDAFDRRSFLSLAAAGAAAGIASTGNAEARAPRRDSMSSDLRALIEAERDAIRAGLPGSGIEGVSVCLLHESAPVWTEGFGRTGAGGRPVGPDTIFSIQSTSKNFTAVAVLLAVQEGLLDLDLPISRYLPDFDVHSRFEAAPADRITLRLLLSNRAGFTHEAPVGNNYEPDSPGFEAHIRSICDTWLRFPVGDRYRYSNLGYDLAGYILQRQSGLGYAEWLRQKVFAPLGMRDSTADPAVYTGVENRAAGHQPGHDRVPPVTPLVASGGVYSSARDMAAYCAFHLARGRFEGRQILARELWGEMHGFALGGDYGLGVIREERRYGNTPVRMLSHAGGGFGFGCVFTYCPEAGLAWTAMFNSPVAAGYRFGSGLVENLLAARFGARAPRLPADALAPIALTTRQKGRIVGSYIGRNVRGDIGLSDGRLRFRREEVDAPDELFATSPDDFFLSGADGEVVRYRRHPASGDLPAHLECSTGEHSLDFNGGPHDPPGPDRPEWSRYVGRYRVHQWGRPVMDVTVERRDGYLHLNGMRLVVETEPGLFFTSDGEAVDFRNAVPTWRNLLLRPV